MQPSPKNPRGAGRKPKEYKQQTYSFRCYPCQELAIREMIKQYKENNPPK